MIGAFTICYRCFLQNESLLQSVVAPEMVSGVYVLQLRKGQLYIGSSSDVNARIHQHRELGHQSAAFVKHCKGVLRVLNPLTPRGSDLLDWERREFVQRVLRHGCHNVRGWEFTQPVLQASQCDVIKTIICGTTPARCRKCGRAGHFMSSCRARSKEDWLLDLERMAGSASSSSRRSQPRSQEPMAKRTRGSCFRCGRRGHMAQQCYARTNARGECLQEESSPSYEYCTDEGEGANEKYTSSSCRTAS